MIPDTLLFDKVDEFVRVNDENSAYMAREIAMKEAIMGGYTTGAVVQAFKQYSENYHFTKDDLVVLIFPDHGSRYMTKIYDDEWMREQGFIHNDIAHYEDAIKV